MAYMQYEKKRLYYHVAGQGTPVLLLHANTMSSHMFAPLAGALRGDYRLIFMDFMGHGQSDPLPRLPADFGYDQALQARALMDHLGLGRAILVGCSGGALAALNLALESPGRVHAVIADSFPGIALSPDALVRIISARQKGQLDSHTRAVWAQQHGDRWLQVVQQDTQMLKMHLTRCPSFFHRDIQTLAVPALFTASKADRLLPDACAIMGALASLVHCGFVHLFQGGAHPAMLTNLPEFASLVRAFLSSSGSRQPQEAEVLA